MNKKIRGYYFITDSGLSRNGTINDVLCALNAGVSIIQYREKNSSTLKMYNEAFELRKLVKDALFIINDRIDICLAVNADGVHLGQDDLPVSITRRIIGKDKIIGVTVHSVEEAIEAEKKGTDYIAVSPIFFTNTKPDAQSPVGLKVLGEVKLAVSVPVVAIGGITLENASAVVRVGADAVCAISAVLKADDVTGEIKKFQQLFKAYK